MFDMREAKPWLTGAHNKASGSIKDQRIWREFTQTAAAGVHQAPTPRRDTEAYPPLWMKSVFPLC